jgi:hypothetical protein
LDPSIVCEAKSPVHLHFASPAERSYGFAERGLLSAQHILIQSTMVPKKGHVGRHKLLSGITMPAFSNLTEIPMTPLLRM